MEERSGMDDEGGRLCEGVFCLCSIVLFELARLESGNS